MPAASSGAEVVSNAAVMLFGGIETTEGMIANAVLHLLSNRDQLALVTADRRRLPNAIEESLRLEPAAAMVDRYATTDVQLGDAAIRRGELVSVSVAAANRDPATFPDPDRFDVRPRERAPAPRLRARAARLHRDAPRAPRGAHRGRAGCWIVCPACASIPRGASAPSGLVFRKPPALHVLWSTETRLKSWVHQHNSE